LQYARRFLLFSTFVKKESHTPHYKNQADCQGHLSGTGALDFEGSDLLEHAGSDKYDAEQ
jgi:hypothetical protein